MFTACRVYALTPRLPGAATCGAVPTPFVRLHTATPAVHFPTRNVVGGVVLAKLFVAGFFCMIMTCKE